MTSFRKEKGRVFGEIHLWCAGPLDIKISWQRQVQVFEHWKEVERQNEREQSKERAGEAGRGKNRRALQVQDLIFFFFLIPRAM